MRFKGTWILLGALVLVAAYFFLVEQRQRAAREQKAKESKRLFSYTRADVVRFVLTNPKGERIEAALRNGSWSIVSPVEAPGDQPGIQSFLDGIVPGRRVTELPDVPNLAAYGLEKPFATVILYRAGPTPPDTLAVGDKTPTSSNSYVRIGSSRDVFISSEITHNMMNKGLLHLRDKNFLPEAAGTATGLTVRSGAKTLVLRKEGGFWWLASPRAHADDATIESYLTRLADAVIHQFVREDTKVLAPYGLARPAHELVLAKGQERLTISFGTKSDTDLVHVMRTGLDKVVLVESSFLDAFGWTAASLRAKNLAFVHADSVATIRYESPDTSVVFTRVRSKWKTATADTAALKWWEVDGMLRTATGTEFERIVAEPISPSDPRLAKPLVRLTLEDAAGALIDRITIAAGPAGTEIGGSASANAVGAVPAGTAAKIETVFRRIGAR